MKREYKCSCRDVDPDHFIENEEVIKLLETKENYKFNQGDYLRLYNCVHCGACGTHYERFLLKQKFLKDGNKIEGLKEQIEVLKKYGTPFKLNKSRIKAIDGINLKSKTLLYFGCFTTVKTPKYGENIAKYLLSKNVDFNVLEKEICCGYPILCTGELNTYNILIERNKTLFIEMGFEKIITVCPSCYMVFKKHYQELGIKIEYFTEYLTPRVRKNKGNLIIQHACPLKYIEFLGIEEELKQIYEDSGYNVLPIPHNCCGGGVGHQLRTDISEMIAIKRMKEFKDNEDINSETADSKSYITTYCPDAYWILKFFGKKQRSKHKLVDMGELLIE
ncbi:MAG: (Fe-S)-binding protein [Candidatus Lokiarchaeota archaeon]|nr:(Fe-S)-binding protein [Candidatus Lokiarchaeota archaeon]